VNLTDEQRLIVRQLPTKRVLVTAGAGTGKTYVLIHRIQTLIEEHNLMAGHEILVLTFSRAAVREIRNRTAAGEGSIKYVQANTFDSFASRLLAEFSQNNQWTNEDYDGRIRAASRLIKENVDARERLRGYSHLFVDEIQDLVGDRAEFVKVILDAIGGGFTLLGDPAQGIYNFQLEGKARQEGSAALYKWLRSRLRNDLMEFRLSENHRAVTSGARQALWAGAALTATEANYRSIKDKLDTLVKNLPRLGKLDDACRFLREVSEPTAILCRDNGQALMISRYLNRHEIPHCLQRRATDRILPAWMGILFRGLEHRKIGRTAFIARSAELMNAAFDANSAWAYLKRANKCSSNSLDVGQIAETIRRGNFPDELIEGQSAKLIVSTIHRAKGLEFERVIVAVPSEGLSDEKPEDLAEETRILYVALTRPKRDLQHMEIPAFRGLHRNQNDNRWFRKFEWKVADFEVRGTDVHFEDPAGGFLMKAAIASEIQVYIQSRVKINDPVILTRLKVMSNGEPRVFYTIEHFGFPIGVTTEAFGGALFRTLKINRGWEVNWPTRIENLRIEGVDTVAGSDAAAQRCRLGSVGLWLRSRVAGLGTLRFETTR
jgi:UvrD-like helicase family protein